ncbi:MAG: 2-amino-4-hydroxy-6-hydroxymethyldihydropteridine diphosphokinase [Eubacteriales bacterium]
MKSYLSLGSNMGDRKKNLEEAIDKLRGHKSIDVLKISSYYETEPWGFANQASFLNIVIEIDVVLDPPNLLKLCQGIENEIGRKRDKRWGPRIIDIDILIYEQYTCETPDLTIPHPLLEEREFVLAPLRELDPNYVLLSGKTVSEAQGQGIVSKLG